MFNPQSSSILSSCLINTLSWLTYVLEAIYVVTVATLLSCFWRRLICWPWRQSLRQSPETAADLNLEAEFRRFLSRSCRWWNLLYSSDCMSKWCWNFLLTLSGYPRHFLEPGALRQTKTRPKRKIILGSVNTYCKTYKSTWCSWNYILWIRRLD